MKVAIICDVLGESNNGTSIAARNLIAYLREQGHEVVVVAPEGSPDVSVTVPTRNLGKFLNGVLEKNGVKLARPDRKILEAVIRDADVVHLLVPFPLSNAAIRIAEKYNKPITASFHCQAENISAHVGMMDWHLFSHITYQVFYHNTYRHCDAVHYPTEFIREVFESETHKKTPAHVISNGVNDVFVPPVSPVKNEKFTIVCSGRYSKEKAQQQLIRAVALLPYRDQIRIVLPGDGPRREYLMKTAEKNHVECEFRFFPREEMVRVLQGADLYVHTAVVEIEAIACTEAICCGAVPVICDSPRSATRFFARGDKTLYRMYDIRDLADKIDYWYRHPEEKAKKSREYEDMRGGFSQRACMRKMEQMLEEAIEGKRA